MSTVAIMIGCFGLYIKFVLCLSCLTPPPTCYYLTRIDYYKETLCTVPTLSLKSNTIFNNCIELTVHCQSKKNEEECKILSSFNYKFNRTDATEVRLAKIPKHKIYPPVGSDFINPVVLSEIPFDKINKLLNVTHFHWCKSKLNNNVQQLDWEINMFGSLFMTDTQGQVLRLLFLITGLSVTISICSLLVLQKYNKIENNQTDEGTRPPTGGMFLLVVISHVILVLYIIYIMLVLAFFGYIIPSKQRDLMSCLITCNICVGTLVGYLSPKIYKILAIKNWTAIIIFTSVLCPGMSMGLFYKNNDSDALQFSILQVIFWLCVSVPFTFTGAFLAFCEQSVEQLALRTDQISDHPIYIQDFPGYTIGEGYKPIGLVSDMEFED